MIQSNRIWYQRCTMLYLKKVVCVGGGRHMYMQLYAKTSWWACGISIWRNWKNKTLYIYWNVGRVVDGKSMQFSLCEAMPKIIVLFGQISCRTLFWRSCSLPIYWSMLRKTDAYILENHITIIGRGPQVYAIPLTLRKSMIICQLTLKESSLSIIIRNSLLTIERSFCGSM